MSGKSSADQKRQLWQSRIDEWKENRLSLAQWSKEQGLSYAQCIYWKNRILGKESPAGFVELAETRLKEEIRVELKGFNLYLPLDLSKENLKRALQAIATMAC